MKSDNLMEKRKIGLDDFVKEKEIERGNSLLISLKAKKRILLLAMTISMFLVTVMLIIYSVIGYSE